MKYRYLGTQSFTEEDASIFFGRKEDTEKLHRLIFLSQCVVLHGKSGMGKTSLLNAAIIPKFEEEQEYRKKTNRFVTRVSNNRNIEKVRFYHVKVRFQGYREGSISPLKKTIDSIRKKFESDIEFTSFGQDSLWETHKHLQNNGLSHVILIFDQFEELFDYPIEQIKEFTEQLAELLYTQVPQYIRQTLQELDKEDELSDEEIEKWYTPFEVKTIFSIRSDKLSLINRLNDRLPNILENCYELQALTEEQAIEAIVLPAEIEDKSRFISPRFSYAPNALEKIIDFLSHEHKRRVESFQLQILCESLERKVIEDGQKTVTSSMLSDIENIFQNYYLDKINALAKGDEQLVSKLRILIEDEFIFEQEQRRIPLYEGQILNHITEKQLNDLATTRLIKVEKTVTDEYMYELSHDTLVLPILKLKVERKNQEARKEEEEKQIEELRITKQKAEKDRLEKEKTQKQLKKTRTLLSIAGIALIVVISLGVFAQSKNKEASRNLKAAKLYSARADTARYQLMRLVDAFYFYDNKFALAYGGTGYNKKFYFIDRSGNKVQKLGEWKEAEQFNKIGLSKVKAEGTYYLLDTLGNTYPLATNLENLNREVTALDLSYQKLSKFPIEITKYTQLKILILQGNRIEKLPSEIKYLKDLEKLMLWENKLTSLPDEIGNLKKLQTLDLSLNKINEIPKEINQLKRLKYLYLFYNDLSKLPNELTELKTLEALDLRNNSISENEKQNLVIKLPNCQTNF